MNENMILHNLHTIGLHWNMLNGDISMLTRLNHMMENKLDKTSHMLVIDNEQKCNGACGDIYFGNFDNIQVAIKKINTSIDDGIKEAFIHTILYSLSTEYKNKFIVPILFVCLDEKENNICLIMERYEGPIKQIINDELLIQFIHEWDCFISFLENKGVKFYHNDLREMNILFKKSNNITQFSVCDFGMSYITGNFDGLAQTIVTSKGLYYGNYDECTNECIQKLRDIYILLFSHDTPTTFDDANKMKRKWKTFFNFYTHFINAFIKSEGDCITVDGIKLTNADLLLHV